MQTKRQLQTQSTQCDRRRVKVIGGESDESETSIHRIERINRITDRNKCPTAVVKVNGIEKEFIFYRGYRITDFNNARGRENTETNRDTKSETTVSRCKQK